MTKPSTITQWLQSPASFNDNDRKAAAALLKTYPYFVPARYMEAAEQHKKQPFAPSTLTTMQLFMGDWIQFYEFMEATGAQPVAIREDEHEAEPALEEEEEAAVEEPVEEEEFEAIEVLDDDELSEFGSWEDEDDYTDIDELEELPPVKPEPVKSKPAFTKKHPLKPAETPAKPAAEKPKPPPAQPAPKKEEAVVEAKQDSPPPPRPPKPAKKADPLIQPIYTEEYFLHQGIQISDFAPTEPAAAEKRQQTEVDKSLMVVMSFSEWLVYFKTKGEKTKEEIEDQKALKSMWQKEKLAAALEEENEEIPESVFEMAVNSITKEDDLASESLAEIMVKQGKYDKAIDMYRKLSLRNPQKSTYFARKIDRIIKENES